MESTKYYGISDFRNVLGYKINVKEPTLFLFSNKQVETEIKQLYHLQWIQNMKYLVLV